MLSHNKRIYDKPQTPFERLKAGGKIDAEKISELEGIKAELNPFALKRRIEKKLRKVLLVSANRTMRVAA